jgi:hypothetical protein
MVFYWFCDSKINNIGERYLLLNNNHFNSFLTDKKLIINNQDVKIITDLQYQISLWLEENYRRYSKSIFSNIAIRYEHNNPEIISLFSPEMILFLDELFSQTSMHLEFQHILKTANNNILNIWNNIEDSLTELCLFAEKAYLLLFLKNSNTEIDLNLIAKRIFSIRKQKTYNYEFISKQKAIKIMVARIIPIDVAFNLYSRTKIKRKNIILAGGDATRYLKIINVLANENNYFLSKSKILDLKNNPDNKDISQLFEIDELKKIFKTPLFQYLGCSLSDIHNAFSSKGIYLYKLKIYLKKAQKTFQPGLIPKAMNIAYKCTLSNKPVYLSFFIASIIRIYSEILRENSFGNELIYVVKNIAHKNAFEASLSLLFSSGKFDEQRLKIKLTTSTSPALPLSDYHKGFIFENRQLKTSSPGHGPAFIKVMNEELMATPSDEISASLRSLDNSGTYVNTYCTLLQKAAVFEHNLREQLVSALRKNTEELNYFFQQLGIFSEKNLKDQIIAFIENRWNCIVSKSMTFSEISEVINNLPISVILVTLPQKATGGGLFVLNNGEMVVLDKNQNKNQTEIAKFNPMIFATYIKNKIIDCYDTECLFITHKSNGHISYKQSESASTHIASCPQKTLNRFIEYNKNNIENVFVQQKTILDSLEDNNIFLSNQLTKDIEFICRHLEDSLQDCINTLHDFQNNFLAICE